MNNKDLLEDTRISLTSKQRKKKKHRSSLLHFRRRNRYLAKNCNIQLKPQSTRAC